jgi:hypothetical protein
MGFWGPKKRKVTENGYQKPVIFRWFQNGLFTFVSTVAPNKS